MKAYAKNKLDNEYENLCGEPKKGKTVENANSQYKNTSKGYFYKGQITTKMLTARGLTRQKGSLLKGSLLKGSLPKKAHCERKKDRK